MNCLYFQLSGGTTPLVVGHTLTGFLATFSPFFPKSGVKPSSEFKWIVLGVSIKMYFLCTLHLHHLSIKFSGLLCRRGPPLAESVPIHQSLPIPRPFTPPSCIHLTRALLDSCSNRFPSLHLGELSGGTTPLVVGFLVVGYRCELRTHVCG